MHQQIARGFITKEGDKVILTKKPSSWETYFKSKDKLPKEYMEGVSDTPPIDEEIPITFYSIC